MAMSLKSTMSISSATGRTGLKKRNYVDTVRNSENSKAPVFLISFLKREVLTKTSVSIIAYTLRNLSDAIISLLERNKLSWRKEFTNLKSEEFILTLAIKYKSKPSVVAPALEIVASMVGDPVNNKLQNCLFANFRDLALFSFNYYGSNEDVLEQLCKAIGYFVIGIPPNRQLQLEFFNAGILGSILSVMKRHRNKRWVQAEGCCALLLLAFDCNTNRRRILKLGGLQAIKIAIKSFPYDINVSKYARLAKKEISVLEKISIHHSATLEARSDIDASQNSVNNERKTHGKHRSSYEVVERSEVEFKNIILNTKSYRRDDIIKGRLSIQVNPTFFKGECIGQNYSYCVQTKPEATIDMLEPLAEFGAKNVEVRNKIAKLGGVKAVVDGMIARQNSIKVQRNGALVLYYLGKGNRKICSTIVKHGGMQVLKNAKENFPNDPYILRWVRLALGEIEAYA